MPNRVQLQIIKKRNQILADLERIYSSEWREIAPEIDSLIDSIYLDQEETTQRERLKYAEKNGMNELADLFVAAVILANTKAIKQINTGMDKIYEINAADISRYINDKTGVSIDKKGVNIKDLLSKYTKRRYDNATDSKYIKKEVLQEINKMLKAGEGTKKISQRLQKVFYKNKVSADRITLTETTRIQSQGRLEVMKEAAKLGIIFKKIWRHQIHVKKPRDWHVDMDGEKRELEEPFSNGLQFPGDPKGRAKEVINCGCFLDESLERW